MVFLGRCTSYADEDVGEVLGRLLRAAKALEGLRKGAKVLVKPNLLSARRPEQAVTTHPAVVGALVELLIEAGAKPLISDSPGGAIRGTRRVFENTGMLAVAEKLGVEIVPLETAGVKKIPLPDGETLILTSIVDEVDWIVPVAKLKTHSLTLTTLSVKNLYGLIPGFMKAEYHKLYPSPRRFSWLLAELFERVREKILFGVVDGIVGMDGNGPSSGRIRQIGLLAVSRDIAAMDDLLERLVGLPKPSPICAELRRRGLVPEAKAVWLDENAVEVNDFRIPSNWAMRLVPSWLGRALGRFVQIYPGVDAERCTRCGECARSCPTNAITMDAEKPPSFDYRRCIRCLCCHEICPVGAVVFRRSFLARFIR